MQCFVPFFGFLNRCPSPINVDSRSEAQFIVFSRRASWRKPFTTLPVPCEVKKRKGINLEELCHGAKRIHLHLEWFDSRKCRTPDQQEQLRKAFWKISSDQDFRHFRMLFQYPALSIYRTYSIQIELGRMSLLRLLRPCRRIVPSLLRARESSEPAFNRQKSLRGMDRCVLSLGQMSNKDWRTSLATRAADHCADRKRERNIA